MAHTYIWLGGSLSFSAGGNWENPGPPVSTGTVPGVADTVEFLQGFGGTLSGSGSVTQVAVVYADLGISGNLQAGTISVTSNTLGPVPAYGRLTVAGGTVTTTNGLGVFVGSSATVSAAGTLEVDGANGFLSYGPLMVASGSLTVLNVMLTYDDVRLESGSGTISTLELAGVGKTLDIGGNFHLGATEVFLGHVGGAMTFATVHDGGYIGSLNGMIVGNQGSASLTVASGGYITLSNGGVFPALGVGSGGGSSGTVDITGATSYLVVEGIAAIGNAGNASVTVEAGGQFLVTGTLDGGKGSNGHGAITVTGAGSAERVTGDALIGDGGHESDLIAAGGSANVTGELKIGAQTSGSGTLALTGGSSILNAHSDAVAGYQGAGTLSLANGASLSVAGMLSFGLFATGAGTATVSDAGTQISAAQGVTVGGNGTGVVTLQAGASIDLGQSGALVIGDGQTGAGTLTASGVGSNISGGGLQHIVGNAGTGALVLSNQATMAFINSYLRIGAQSGAVGSLDVSGDTTGLTALDVVDGDAGAGTLDVASLGRVTVGNSLVLGASNGGSGSLDVSGAGTLSVGGDLTVGDAGAGTMTVNTGSISVFGELTLGNAASASGFLSIQNEGARLTDFITVGNGGAGTLEVLSNTKLRGNNVVIGATSGATGFVTLDGSGGLEASLTADAVLAVGGGIGGAGGSGRLVINSNAVASAASADIWSSGTLVLAGGTLTGGPITVQGEVTGFGTLDGALDNSGTIGATGGSLVVTGALTASGTLTVTAGAVLRLESTSAASQTVTFSGGKLVLDSLAGSQAVIAGFGRGDTIDIAGVAADTGSFAGGVLALSNSAGGGGLGALSVAGAYQDTNFHVVALNPGTTEITFAAACFAASTGLATAEGRVDVAALREGTMMRLAGGGEAPAIWIGHRRVDCARHPRPWDVWPVRVEAGAFGPGQPAVDLVLSPDHAVFVAEVLIPIRYLINGASIRQEEVASVTYYHVELPAHGVLLAEGLPVESYLDTGNRAAFANGGVVSAVPDFGVPEAALAVWARRAVAPLVCEGAVLSAQHAALRARAVVLGYAIDRSPELRVTCGGRELTLQRDGQRVRARLPEGGGEVRIQSRSFVPAHGGSECGDHRRGGGRAR